MSYSSLIVLSRLTGPLFSICLLVFLNKFMGPDATVFYFKTYSIIALTATLVMMSTPVLIIRERSGFEIGIYRIRTFLDIIVRYKFLYLLGILLSIVFFVQSTESINNTLNLILAACAVFLFIANKLLCVNLSVEGSFIKSFFIEGPVYIIFIIIIIFISSFYNIDLNTAIMIGINCSLLVTAVIFFIFGKHSIDFQDSLRFEFSSADLVFITANGFVRSLVDNIVNLTSASVLGVTDAVNALLLWRMYTFIIMPLKALQNKIAVSFSSELTSGIWPFRNYFKLVGVAFLFSLAGVVIIYFLLSIGWVNEFYPIDLSSTPVFLVVMLGILAVLVGPAGIVCELLKLGRILFLIFTPIALALFYWLIMNAGSLADYMMYCLVIVLCYEGIALGISLIKMTKMESGK